MNQHYHLLSLFNELSDGERAQVLRYCAKGKDYSPLIMMDNIRDKKKKERVLNLKQRNIKRVEELSTSQ